MVTDVNVVHPKNIQSQIDFISQGIIKYFNSRQFKNAVSSMWITESGMRIEVNFLLPESASIPRDDT